MKKVLTYKIQRETKLSAFMSSNFSARLCALIKNDGKVLINQKEFLGNPVLVEGDSVEITVPERLNPFEGKADLPVKVLFKNEDFLVVDKPVNMPSIPTKGHYTDNLIAALTNLYPTEVFRVITRLDKDTSGLVLVALNALSCEILQTEKVRKKYLALLSGKLAESTMVDAKIYRESGMKRIVDERGKPSKTHFKVLSYTDEGNTLCECELFTGRTHQIRVHSASIGHPLVGDELYGKSGQGKNCGQNLKCVFLAFEEPFTKELLEFRI